MWSCWFRGGVSVKGSTIGPEAFGLQSSWPVLGLVSGLGLESTLPLPLPLPQPYPSPTLPRSSTCRMPLVPSCCRAPIRR